MPELPPIEDQLLPDGPCQHRHGFIVTKTVTTSQKYEVASRHHIVVGVQISLPRLRNALNIVRESRRVLATSYIVQCANCNEIIPIKQ